MGGCCSSGPDQAYDPQMAQDHRMATRLQAEEERGTAGRRMPAPAAPRATLLGATGARPDWGAPPGGKRLGGGDAAAGGPASAADAEELRQRALEAAERRQANVPGMSQQKAAEMRARQQKDTLLGRITEHYHRRKLEMPMGLNVASADQLRRHWEALQREAA
eukprot:CAMPEP_0204521828 /NCGR_PEP_ID=MMETSP0661-20131031/5992_1 /ASSEMBLY_ACC=CAM_ASM_000606 /TAXON_ID=109239 /ORGANISM="Alexandrium margalefi, Strain AMGDE01CS-322" /LENGTH=162 /DNA_ID=CAMNT_0051527451 /DNA_START=72 /DNA_END=560 /DNA_ORIENTATION=+